VPLQNGLFDDPELARAYASKTAGNFWNARYERPAIRALAGDVAGLDVLDAGCAAGENAAWLLEAGARVTALDASPAMIELTRSRTNGRANAIVADLAAPLPLENASFDLVLSSLTMHYLESWHEPLAEFRRVLRPDGRLVVSTHHPHTTLEANVPYGDVRLIRERWTGFSQDAVEVRFYHRPLSRIVNDVLEAGFRLVRMAEPGIPSERREGEREQAARVSAWPSFLLLEATLA